MALDIYYFSNFLFPFIIYSSTLRMFRCVPVFEYQIININQYLQNQLKRLCQFDNNALSLKSSALVAFN